MLVNSAPQRRTLFIRHKRTLLAILFVFLYSVSITLAVPPDTKYAPGATLDPACAPGDTNCSVQVLADQTGNTGKLLTTNGTLASWTSTLSDISFANSPILISAPATSGGGYTLLTRNSTTGVVESVPSTTYPSGSGTTNYIAKFTSANILGNSLIYDNGTRVGVGTTTPASKLSVIGGTISIGTTTAYADPTWQFSSYDTVNQKGVGIGYPSGNRGNAIQGLVSATNGILLINPYGGNVGVGETTPNSLFTVGEGDLFQVTSAGAIATVSGYTQSGTTANTFTGITTFSNATYSALFTGGNVGIGTTAPLALLQLEKNTAATVVELLRLKNAGGSTNAGMEITGRDSANNKVMSIVSQYDGTTWNMYMGTYANEQTITLKGGNVGIGTTGPLQKLQVAGLGVFTQVALTGDPGIGMGPATLVGYNSTSDYGFISAINSGVAVKNLSLQPIGGNVGIGTTTPNQKFVVYNAGAGAGAITSAVGADYLLMGNQDSLGVNNPSVIQAANGQFAFGHGDSWSNSVGGTFTPSMTILNNGNVGIGTTTPYSKLGIVGTNAILTIDNLVTDAGTVGIELLHLGGSSAYTSIYHKVAILSDAIGGFGKGNLHLAINTVSDNSNVSVSDAKLSINGTTGNVGIGTTTPTEKLDVNGNIALAGDLIDSRASNSALVLRGTNTDRKLTINTGTAGVSLEAHGSVTHDLFLGSDTGSGYQALTIQGSTGNVGVGTTAPGSKLDVLFAADRGIRLDGTLSNESIITSYQGTVSSNIRPLRLRGETLTFNTGDGSNTTGAEALRITSTGNVGIGTTLPGHKLDIQQDSDTALTMLKILNTQGAVGSTNEEANIEMGLSGPSQRGQQGVLLRAGKELDYSSAFPEANTDAFFAINVIQNDVYSERLRITSSGNVGIGNTGNSSYKLLVSGNNSSVDTNGQNTVFLAAGTSVSYIDTSYIGGGSYVPLAFGTGGSERMRILTNGNVGIGTTSPGITPTAAYSSGTNILQIGDTVSGQGVLQLVGQRVTGARLGIIDFSNTSQHFASIDVINDVTGTFDGGAIRFHTQPAGAAAGIVERMRINSVGNVGIGTTSPGDLLTIDINKVGQSSGFTLRNSNINGWGHSMQFQLYGYGGSTPAYFSPLRIETSYPGYGTVRFITKLQPQSAEVTALELGGNGNATFSSLGTGTVYSNAGTLTNTNPSDRNLKNTINDLAYGLDEIRQLNPKTYYYNDDTNHQRLQYGFIAQDIQAIMPELVRPIGNGYLGLETNGIYVTMVRAIQELDIKVQALQANQGGTANFGEYASLFFADALQKVENGVAYIKDIVVETLKVGSPTKRTGITLYDEITGEPYCLSVANGITKTTAGECVIIEPTPVANNITIDVAANCTDGIQNQDETGVDTGGVCTPETCSDGIMNQDETGVDEGGVCTPTPDPTLEPVVEPTPPSTP